MRIFRMAKLVLALLVAATLSGVAGMASADELEGWPSVPPDAHYVFSLGFGGGCAEVTL